MQREKEVWPIGLSGFSNKDWIGSFYPEKLPQNSWFSFYCDHINCVDIYSSFYRVPTLKTLQNWKGQSGPDFRFSLKAPRAITHFQQFRESGPDAAAFYALLAEGIGEKLGAVLFQCPPKFSFTEDRLELLLKTLDPAFPNVVEFRHKSWWTAEVVDALSTHKTVFCGVDYPGDIPNEVMVQPGLFRNYYRFHGRPVLFKSLYTEEEIRVVYEQLQASEIPEKWVAFNNTWGHSALQNAAMLKEMLNR